MQENFGTNDEIYRSRMLKRDEETKLKSCQFNSIYFSPKIFLKNQLRGFKGLREVTVIELYINLRTQKQQVPDTKIVFQCTFFLS